MLKMYVKYSWKQHHALCLQTHREKIIYINIQSVQAEKDMKRLFARLQTSFMSKEKEKQKKQDIDFIEQTGTSVTKLWP